MAQITNNKLGINLFETTIINSQYIANNMNMNVDTLRKALSNKMGTISRLDNGNIVVNGTWNVQQIDKILALI
jgi:translation initiation factor 2 beta subunit (eIF-2beta)/eIF-5